ncbi:MAG: aminotransferase class III-fold pyridoxal phosphate-dependent enzyme [Hyphomicrobiales bacterium]
MTSSAAAISRPNQNLSSALAEAEQRYIAANPKSAKLNAEARANLPGGNTRTTVHFSPFPLYIASGKGSRLTDSDGHSYVDFINEYTAGVFGHSNQVIARAITETVAQGLNFGAPTRHEIALSAEIRKRFPAMELLRFCNSGTEANLLALALARAVTEKDSILVFNGAYHGSLFYFSHGASPLNMPMPVVTSTYNDIDKMKRDVAANARDLAAVIIEPMQGGAGALPADRDFITALRDATKQHGVLLIFDEVMTSRTHVGGMQAYFGVRPDLVTLGKYIAGGLTIGAFGGRADLMSRFDPARPDAFPHGGTFNNNVVAMAAGCAALTELLTADNLNRMNALGDRLRGRLTGLAAKHDLPMLVTGFGSIFGIHFHQGAARNIDDLDRGETGRERAVADLKKLFHLDMIAAGHYISRRIMGNLSLETSVQETDSFVEAVDEFLVNRGSLMRDAFA